jgi:hypothetical protein
MSIIQTIRLILEILKETLGYGKKAEKRKLEQDVEDRATDKLDWIRMRMRDQHQTRRDEETDPEQ